MAQLSIRIVEEANIGLRKKEQQDFHGHVYIPANPTRGYPACCLLALADGVSMGAAGALASRTAVEVLLAEFNKLYALPNPDPASCLEKAVYQANLEVYTLARERPGMATTLVAAMIIGNQMITTHVGDSRAYIHRSGVGLRQVTTDHSWTVEYGEVMVRRGRMSEKELRTDNRRHSITRALGLDTMIQADYTSTNLKDQDMVLMCSDGLWDSVPLDKLDSLLDAAMPQIRFKFDSDAFNELCHKMVLEAMEAGGRDNITVSLGLVNTVGENVLMPGLPKLLARTASDLQYRLNLEVDESPPIGNDATLGAIPYTPLGSALLKKLANDTPEAGTISRQESPDTTVARGQQLFAFGQWEEGLNELLGVERVHPGQHGLYEVLSGLLVRYIGTNILNGENSKADWLYQLLQSQNINRYDNLIFDYCLEESRKAGNSYNYRLALDFADFAGRFKKQDGRVRNLQELSRLYLELERPGQTVEEKLALAQRLYARDAGFGAIQDDLATVYMELGDIAVEHGAVDEAFGWFELIRPLRPRDTRIISLANSKIRALEDKQNRLGLSTASALPQTTAQLTPQAATAKMAAVAPDHTRPDHETVNRMKERVSRAQKAWDNGRKEIGAEYIYLVEQFSQIISPNPWEPTFPRVCYDYGKWLLEQRQYAESRPFFIKARDLGMAAAQQRLNEVDRLEREQAAGKRGMSPLDLPADAVPPAVPYNRRPAAEPTQSPPASPAPAKPVPPAAAAANGHNKLEKPLPPPPRDILPLDELPALQLTETENLPVLDNDWPKKPDRFAKPERLVGVSGTARNLGLSDPLQDAASRVSGRQAITPPPTTAKPQRPISNERFFDSAFGLLIPVLIGLVVGLFGLVVLIYVLGRIGQPNTDAANATVTNAVTTRALATPTAPRSAFSVGARLDGVGGDLVQVWLAPPGSDRTAWLEMKPDPTGSFFLSDAQAAKLDKSLKYSVVVRPKDTATRKYRQDLPLEDPLQTLYIKSDQVINSLSGLSVSWKIPAEAINFYPMAGGTTDANLPDNARYIAATRHILRGDFLQAYDTTGGLARYGYPISEEFDLTNIGHVQFFERSWLLQSTTDKTVKVGNLTNDVLNLQNCDLPPKPPAGVGTGTPKISTIFTEYYNLNKAIGQPVSAAFEVSTGNTKRRIQYFEFARLEALVDNAGARKGPVELGLLGSEFARCLSWLR